MDAYSEVLGMTPREHERKMRFWYVLLGIVGFFGVFGEGMLVMSSRWKASRAEQAQGSAATPAIPPAVRTEFDRAPNAARR